MRFIEDPGSHSLPEGSGRRRRRQTVALALALALAGCAKENEADRGKIGFVKGFIGGVAADVPRAAVIGREILSSGGNAADAAVATYFALAVTMPSSASLGGGGICLVHDWKRKTTEALDFLSVAPARVPEASTRPNAVPGNPRGFFALHAKYGRLRWQQVVAPAANLARFGEPVSRAFAHEIAKVERPLLDDAEMRRVFGRPGGRSLVREGDFLIQVDLAGVLGQMGAEGPGDFYSGQTARRLVEAALKAGGSLGIEDLRSYKPEWRDTIKVPTRTWTAHFAPPPAAAGAVEAAMWTLLTQVKSFDNASEDEKPHLFVEAALRAFADRGQWLKDGGLAKRLGELASPERVARLMASYRADRHVPADALVPAPVPFPENPAATGFAVVDRESSAVACALTMNNLFGTGRVAPGTGIIFATLPGEAGRGPTSLGPMMIVNHHTNEFFLAAAAAGGVVAPTALMNVAARAVIENRPLEDALAAKRLHHGGHPDLVYYEQGLADSVIRALKGRGHQVSATDSLGLVNIVYCARGLPPNPESCSVGSDPRGYGLATSADR
jgi:gamma-glutamyltranspeptidase/glutathione hydrolase